MRYALRNMRKIEKAYSFDVLKRIVLSIEKHFEKENPLSDAKVIGSDKYMTLIIDDADHSCNLIAFYVIRVRFDVVNLAFKEFIG